MRSDWKLACKECKFEFPDDLPMGVVEAHFLTEHGCDAVSLDLVWKGDGPAPQPNRSERRKHRRKKR